MKKLALLVAGSLSLLMLTFAPLAAAPCDSEGAWDVGVDVLYWKPVHCIIDYATNAPSAAVGGQIFGISADYEWGVRAKGSYTTDCLFGELSYLYFSADDCVRNQNVTTLIFVRQNEENLITKLQHEYQNVDLRAGFTACCGCHGHVQFFANARWVNLRKRLKQILTSEDNAQLRLGAQFDGGGVGVGVRGRYVICGNLGLSGLANPMALIGSHKTPPFFVRGPQFEYNSYTSVVPALDLRLAFDCEWACQCATVIFELGYELNYYFNAFSMPNATRRDTVNPIVRRRCEDIGFAGPFLSVKAHF